MDLLHAVYEPAGDGPHPTIIALHGWGANALDLLGLAPYLAGGRFLVLCPQGPLEVPLGPAVGYGWFPITAGRHADPQDLARRIEALQGFIDEALPRYPIDPKKLVCLGFSQGGVMAYALALGDPERYAGLVALSSWLPQALIDSLPATKQAPLAALVHHGARDPMIEAARGRESVDRLRRLGVEVTFREFEMGHEINAKSLADLSTWLQEKILSPIVLLG